MQTEAKLKFQDLIQDFNTAMLVTRSSTGELRSRPMANAEVQPDGTLWFLTQSDSAKLDGSASVGSMVQIDEDQVRGHVA
jgi:general stress protein 26